MQMQKKNNANNGWEKRRKREEKLVQIILEKGYTPSREAISKAYYETHRMKCENVKKCKII